MNQNELQNTVLCGDALEVLKTLPDECVQMCVTSPPYYGLRDYGAEGQIGCEQTPFEYIDRLTEIFREVRRVLKSNGTLWLNIADSYAGSGKGVWSKSLAERPKSKQTYHSLNTDENAALPKKWDGIKASRGSLPLHFVRTAGICGVILSGRSLTACRRL